MKKIVVIGVSAILVVGAVIGVIVGVNKTGSSSSDTSQDVDLSTSGKAVATLCTPTDYKKTCVDTLSAVANNQSATPNDFIKAAIDVTMQEIEAAMKKTSTIGQGATEPVTKMGLEDCQDLLQFAIAELQASFSMVGDASAHNVSDREAELRNWLSAVVSYQQTCMDGVTQPDLKEQVANGMLNATQLTSNALAIVSAITQILTAFNIPVDNTASSRRLLEATTEKEDESYFPSWMGAGDRKLLASGNNNIKPNAVVAKDGSGQYKTIAAALAAYPRKTMVTGSKCNTKGFSTFKTASFSAIGNGFIAKSMGFQNTAGPQGHQAVALRVQSDMSAFYNCRMDGYQDTLYVQTHRQFYRNCVISGTVDFIFGDSTTVIQNSLIIVRKPMDNQQNTVTAHGRAEKHESTGLVIQNCRIVPEQKLYPLRLKIPSFLGRPWKQYSRTVIMESTLGDLIQPAGWMPWEGTFALDTLYYAEYANRGPGAATNNRVKWKGYKVITNRNEALQFTAGPFIQGNLWLRNTGAPYFLGFKN